MQMTPLVRCHLTAFFFLASFLLPIRAQAPPSNGIDDATAAIQAELDAAGAKGGEVYLPPGQYLLRGNLTIPAGVCLR